MKYNELAGKFFENKKMKNKKDCRATLKVNFHKYFDSGKIRILECCLFHPHNNYKHYNPSLVLTCGGHNVPDEEKIKDWSGWIEKITK